MQTNNNTDVKFSAALRLIDMIPFVYCEAAAAYADRLYLILKQPWFGMVATGQIKTK